MTGFDVAVIGLGAMGAAATHALARRGRRVIGVERFRPAHDLGSSHGESRIIRTSYFEDPAYVPLARLAFDAWRRLEAETGERVLIPTGILEAGVPGSESVAGSLRSVLEHDIPHERLTARMANARFPAFDLPAPWEGLFQPDAGVLAPEKAIGLQVAAAADLGATIRLETRVIAVEPSGEGVRITLEGGERIEAAAAIVAAGPWIGDLVPDLAPHLALTRQCLMWFDPVRPADVTPAVMPVFLIDTGEDLLYGMPALGPAGVKAASHHASGVLTGADAPRAPVAAADVAAIHAAISRFLPAAAGPLLQAKTCVYTRTEDSHFVVGPHPEAPRIVLASPCSGHGFKFAALLGEALADLATTGESAIPIALFDPRRLLSP